MHVAVLGAGAGGGLPQWNCGCQNCSDARIGKLPQMTQSSVGVSADGDNWVVLNASPDIRVQLAQCKDMHPRSVRHTPIRSIVLTNGDIDHIAGLLTLREKTELSIFATAETASAVHDNSVFGVLDRTLVSFEPIVLDAKFEPAPGLSILPFAVPGKVPLFLEGNNADLDLKAMGEQTIGLCLSAGGRTLYYIPGCADLPDWLVERLSDADLLLFDGTVWEDDDMRRTGTGQKTGGRMGHISITGPEGSLARLSGLSECRKVYIHINNTNPILQPEGLERETAMTAGWEIAQDGMRFEI